jgi:hypothetical protein
MKFVWLFFLILASSAFAQTGESISVDWQAAPKTVVEKIDCGMEPSFVTRRAFAGGFVFAAQCPGNHANYIQALVYADNADGANARLLLFPRPGNKSDSNPADSLANIRWYPKAREVTELFVDPESKICRTEGRWRLDAKAQPQLVFWRQARDCKGKSGWCVAVDRR